MLVNRSDVHYFEEVYAHSVIGFVIFLVIALMVYLGIAIPRVPTIALIFVSTMLGFIYINFMKLKIIITSKQLRLGFGIFNYSVQLENIDYIEIRKPPWYWYGGLGIRLGWDWSIGFLQKFGRGVRITPKRGRRLFFSTNNPEAIVNIVNDLIHKMEKTGREIR